MTRQPSAPARNWKTGAVVVALLAVTAMAVGLRYQRTRPDPQGEPVVEPTPADPPAHAPRERLLSELKQESVEQTIDALPSFLDHALATIGSGASVHHGPESYSLAVATYPRLGRVRKLLSEIPADRRGDYAKVLIGKLDDAQKGYPAARRAQMDSYNRKKPGESHSRTEPTEYDRKRAIAGAAVYVLTEWDRGDGLPAFRRLLEEPDPIPVNRLFLLYCTHLVLETFPDGALSRGQRERAAEYKQLAARLFPPAPPRGKVAAWDAKYDEKDWRGVILHEKIPHESQPTILVRSFPKLNHLEDVNYARLREPAEVFQRVLLAFLRAE